MNDILLSGLDGKSLKSVFLLYLFGIFLTMGLTLGAMSLWGQNVALYLVVPIASILVLTQFLAKIFYTKRSLKAEKEPTAILMNKYNHEITSKLMAQYIMESVLRARRQLIFSFYLLMCSFSLSLGWRVLLDLTGGMFLAIFSLRIFRWLREQHNFGRDSGTDKKGVRASFRD